MLRKIFSSLLLVALSFGDVQAQEMFGLNPGQEVRIDRHGTCRIVRNNGGNAIMIPARNANEWHNGGNAFLNNMHLMHGVSAQGCAPPPGPWGGLCGYGRNSCVFLDWWAPTYIAVLNGNVVHACFSGVANQMGNGWPDHGWLKGTFTNYAHSRIASWDWILDAWPLELRQAGFVDATAARLDRNCDISLGHGGNAAQQYERWYNQGVNYGDLRAVFRDWGFGYHMGGFIRDVFNPQRMENAEMWTYDIHASW